MPRPGIHTPIVPDGNDSDYARAPTPYDNGEYLILTTAFDHCTWDSPEIVTLIQVVISSLLYDRHRHGVGAI